MKIVSIHAGVKILFVFTYSICKFGVGLNAPSEMYVI